MPRSNRPISPTRRRAAVAGVTAVAGLTGLALLSPSASAVTPRADTAAQVAQVASAITATAPDQASAAVDQAAPTAGSAVLTTLGVYANGQPGCSVGQAATADPALKRTGCGYANFTVTDPDTKYTAALFAEGATTPFATPAVTASTTAGVYRVPLTPAAVAGNDWSKAAGTVHLVLSDSTGQIGETYFFFNKLVGTLTTAAVTAPGAPFAVTGTLAEHSFASANANKSVPATYKIRVTGADGTVLFTSPTQTATSAGAVAYTVPAEATSALTSTQSVSVDIVEAAYNDTTTGSASGAWAASTAATASHAVKVVESVLSIADKFVSSVGWVKPGEEYPSTIVVSNPTSAAVSPSVRITAPTGSTLLGASGAGTHPVAGNAITWAPGSLAAGASTTLVLDSRAAKASELPTVVYRDLSTTAVLSAPGKADVTSVAHGPKVIPADDTFNTARYGDRPFPIIPVQYNDRTYQTQHSGEGLAEKINSPSVVGSTYNLYQEMSLKQLYPNGTVPSAAIATAGFDYAPGFPFTKLVPGGTCAGGATYTDLPVDVKGTGLYPDRVTDGVYNLPGNTAYYGSDANGSAVVGSATGVGALQNIDAGCGPTGKLVADAVAIADPDIDYSDYDTDKDGVVDFFMAVYAGCGGNGASQIPMCTSAQSDTASYDNIWPHSSSLEGAYTDPATGLPGFVTDDQLKDLEGRPLWWTDDTYTAKTTTPGPDALKVFVRVGPYNVNPETAIDHASVISHEYGHSLGLPDFYSTGSRETYGDWNLMATDKSQNMDAFSRQQLGWVVPQAIPDGTTKVSGITNSKIDTGSIAWQTPDGTPYTLKSGTDGVVHNSQMFVAKLPGRTLLDTSAFTSGAGATPKHLWWSGSGNDFGCAPTGGHNFDLAIPGLADLPKGTPVKLSFKSRWDIEWDFDYGFVLTTTDGGSTYTSHASDNGYTTSKTGVPAGNPNMSGCLDKYDNGITGSSGSYAAGTETPDRLTGTYTDPSFVADSYDISDLAGAQTGALRFSYSTDPGAARPGWFIDDVKVVATVGGVDKTLYATDFENSGTPEDSHVYNGGCREDLLIATSCTKGWKFLAAGAASVQDHAYYLELRDRSGFDNDSHGENDRDAIGWDAGLYLSYTDEAHGDGNVGTDDPPAQSPLDSTPTPGSDTPNLNDAAFTDAPARSTFSDASASPHIDNYTDPTSKSGNWEFGYDCLGFTVNSLTGAAAGQVSDLTGDVTFTKGKGCAPIDYGAVPEPAVVNTAPTAKATATPATASTGQTVQLSADGTTDAETPGSLDYSWDFGDGGSTKDAAVANPTVVYSQAGTYTATLTVTDPQGLSSKATTTVTVTGADAPDTAPTAMASANPSTANIGQAVALSSSGTTDAETPDSLTYSWDFGDGGSTVDATTKDASVTYTTSGTKTVTLTVTDPGNLSDTATTTVTVTPDPTTPPDPTDPGSTDTTPPTVRIQVPARGFTLDRVRLTSNGTSDETSAAGDLTYSWNFGNEGSPTDATTKDATARYARAGVTTVTLTVTDEAGNSASAHRQIHLFRYVTCNARNVKRQGHWTVRRDPAAHRGVFCDTSNAKRKGTTQVLFSFSGSVFQIQTARAKDGGNAKVYVDDKFVNQLTFHASSTKISFGHVRLYKGLNSGKHTVRIVQNKGKGYLEGFVIRDELR